MMALLRSLRREQRGSAIIELALIAPMLATLVIGVADISTAYGRKLALEQGAQRAIEKVMQTTGDTTVASTIQKEAVCQVNGANEDDTCKEGTIATSDVTVTYRLECTTTAGARTTQTSSDATAFDALECANATDREARYISATIVDTYTPMFSLHFGTESDGKYHLSTTAGVRIQ